LFRQDSHAGLTLLVDPLAVRFATVFYPLDDERSLAWNVMFGYRGRRYYTFGRPFGGAALELAKAIATLYVRHRDPFPTIR
jgi:hypothetical protein